MGPPSRIPSSCLTRCSVRMLPEEYVCVGEMPTKCLRVGIVSWLGVGYLKGRRARGDRFSRAWFSRTAPVFPPSSRPPQRYSYYLWLNRLHPAVFQPHIYTKYSGTSLRAFSVQHPHEEIALWRVYKLPQGAHAELTRLLSVAGRQSRTCGKGDVVRSGPA